MRAHVSPDESTAGFVTVHKKEQETLVQNALDLSFDGLKQRFTGL